MNRNTVIVDGTKPGSRPAAKRPEPTRTSAPQGATRQAPVGLNGMMVWKAAQRLGPEPHRVQLPAAARRDAGNEIWWNGGDDSGKVGGHGLPRVVPDRDEHALQGRVDRPRRSTGSSRATGAAAPGTRPTPATSTTPATTSAPASRCATRSSTTPGPSSTRSATRARTPAAAGRSRTRSSTTTRTGSTPTARTATTRRRRTAPARTADQPDHPHPLVLGVHAQLRPRQQQPQRAERGLGGGRARSAPACRSPAAATTRSWTTGSSTTTPGASIFVPYPDSGPPCTGGTLELAAAWARQLPVRRLGRRRDRQHVHPQRRLRQPDQRRLRPASTCETASDDCFRGNTEVGGGPDSRRRGAARPSYPTCTPTPVAREHQRPVPQRGPVRHAGAAWHAVRLPAGRPLPAPDAGRHAPPAASSLPDDAESVCRACRRTRGARGTRAAARTTGY